MYNAVMTPFGCEMARLLLMLIGVACGTANMLSCQYQDICNSHTHTYLLLELDGCEYSGSQSTLANRAGVNIGG